MSSGLRKGRKMLKKTDRANVAVLGGSFRCAHHDDNLDLGVCHIAIPVAPKRLAFSSELRNESWKESAPFLSRFSLPYSKKDFDTYTRRSSIVYSSPRYISAPFMAPATFFPITKEEERRNDSAFHRAKSDSINALTFLINDVETRVDNIMKAQVL